MLQLKSVKSSAKQFLRLKQIQQIQPKKPKNVDDKFQRELDLGVITRKHRKELSLHKLALPDFIIDRRVSLGIWSEVLLAATLSKLSTFAKCQALTFLPKYEANNKFSN